MTEESSAFWCFVIKISCRYSRTVLFEMSLTGHSTAGSGANVWAGIW